MGAVGLIRRSVGRLAAICGSVFGLVAVLALTAPASAAPTVHITSPAEGAQLPLNWTQVEFEVAEFVLDPTAIGGANVAGRGHVHVFLDGAYLFMSGETKVVVANLTAGNHAVRIQLHHNDHTPVDPPVWHEVNITAQGNRAGITITAPAAGATVWGDSVAVTVAVENFTIDAAAVGSSPVQGRGHWHVFVDGNYVQYVLTTTVTLTALTPGSHTVRAALYNHDHTPLAVRVFTEVAVDVAPIPTISILTPGAGASTTTGQVTLTVSVSDLVLDASALGGIPQAGHGNYEVRVDGVFHGASTNLSYLVEGLSVGEHVISVDLHNNDHTPIPGAAADNVTVHVGAPPGFLPGPGAGAAGLAIFAGAMLVAATSGTASRRRRR